MDDLKKIMYGVTDFALMRRENAYFVDRTGLIRELDARFQAEFCLRLGESCAVTRRELRRDSARVAP